MAWESRGYHGGGNVGGLIDSLASRPAIVAGNGKGVFDEVEQAYSRVGNMAVVFSANDVGVYLPVVHHMVSLHSTKLALWVALRRDGYSRPAGNSDFQVHDAGLFDKQDWYQWQGLTPIMALSGYFAMQIAYLMGCFPIILCGCPGDNTPRFWETTCTNPGYARSQQQIKEEMEFKPDFKKVVRSMSGWTRKFFGGIDAT